MGQEGYLSVQGSKVVGRGGMEVELIGPRA